MTKHITAFLWLLLASATASAATNTPADEYQQLLAQESEQAGDIAFDLQLGAAALAASDPGAAVFAFQRVLAQQAENPEAHMGIARAYFDLGEDSSARRHFGLLYPVASVETKAFIDTYIDALDDRSGQRGPSTAFYAGMDVGYDNNITQIFDGQAAGVTGIFAKQSSSFANLNFGAFHQQPINAVWHWQVGGAGDIETYFNFDDFDKRRLAANGGVGGRVNAWRWNFDLGVSDTSRDGERLYTTTSLAGVLEHREDRFWKKAGLRLLQRDYDLAIADRDVSGYEIVLGARHAGPTVRWSDIGVDLYIGDESADDTSADDFGRDYVTARLRWYLLLHPRVRVAAGYDFSRSDFKDLNTPRDDDFHSLLARVSVANVWRKGLELNAEISRDENRSSESTLTYDRDRISLGLTYNWGI